MPQGFPSEMKKAQAEHPGAMTTGQLRKLLGLSDSTMKRYVKAGRIPPAELELPNGWPLWSDQQCKDLLARRLTLGRVYRNRV